MHLSYSHINFVVFNYILKKYVFDIFVLISSFLITFFYSIDVSFVSQKTKTKKEPKIKWKAKRTKS